MSDKKKKVEWSFDFESLGERVSQFFDDALGDDDSAVKSVELATPLDGADSAVVEIDFSIGKASLRALDGASDQLMTARLDYVGEYSFDVSGASHRHVTLRQSGQFPKGLKQIIGKRKELRWDIALARGIPLQLRIKGGVGETDIDLSGLQLDDIKLQTGVGKIALTLPAQNASYDAAVSGGVGKTDIVVPMGSHGHLDIDGGVGEVIVSVSSAATVRARASAGLGKVDMPASYIRKTQSDSLVGADGIWESADYAEADETLSIEFDGGIGRFELQLFETV